MTNATIPGPAALADNMLNPSSMHSERTTRLLLDFAALCETTSGPSAEWLAERHVSLDELYSMMSTAAIAIRGYALSSKPVQSAILLASADTLGVIDQRAIESILMRKLAEHALARSAEILRQRNSKR